MQGNIAANHAPLEAKDNVRRHFSVDIGGQRYQGSRGVNTEGFRFIRVNEVPNPSLEARLRPESLANRRYQAKIYQLAAQVLSDYMDGVVKKYKSSMTGDALDEAVANHVIDIEGDISSRGKEEFSKAMIILCELHGLKYNVNIDGLRQYDPSETEKQRARDICAIPNVHATLTPVISVQKRQQQIDDIVLSTASIATPRPGRT